MPPSPLRQLLAVCLLALTAFASAGISPSNDTVLGKDQQALLRSINRPLDFPEGHALIIADIGVAYDDVYIIGSNQVAPETLAAILDAWSSDSGDVRYAKGANYAIAKWSGKHPSQWGLNQRGGQTLDLANLRTQLGTVSPNVDAIIDAPSYGHVTPDTLAFQPSGFASRVATVAPGQLLTPVAVSADQPTAGLVTWIFALTVFPSIAAFVLQKARKAHPNDSSKKNRHFFITSSITTALMLPVVTYLVSSRQIIAITDLYFGSRSVEAWSFAALLPFVILFIALTSSLQPEPRKPEAEVVLIKSNARWMLSPALFGFMFFTNLVASSFTSTGRENPILYLFAISVLAFGWFVISKIAGKFYRRPSQTMPGAEDHPVHKMATEVARELDSPLYSLKLPDTDSLIPIYLEGDLTIPRAATEKLTPEELRFAIYFAISSGPSSIRDIKNGLIVLGALFAVGTALGMAYAPNLVVQLAFTIAPIFLLATAGQPYLWHLVRQRLTKGIEIALEGTNDRPAAQVFLEKAWAMKEGETHRWKQNANRAVQEFLTRHAATP